MHHQTEEQKELDTNSRHQKSLTEALCHWRIWNTVIYGWFPTMNFYALTILAPVLGQHYFENRNNMSDNDADSYFAFWFGVFSTISGVCGFLIQSYIGQLSDIYGRKHLLFVTLCVTSISGIILTFTGNIWWYLYLVPLQSISGSFVSMPTVLQASFADVVDQQYRVLIYGIIWGWAGLGSILISLTVAYIESNYGIRKCFYLYDSLVLIAMLWNIFILKETLSADKRMANKIKYQKQRAAMIMSLLNTANDTAHHTANHKQLTQHKHKHKKNSVCTCCSCCCCCCNVSKLPMCCIKLIVVLKEPFIPLFHIRDNKLVFWVSMIGLFTALPESGMQTLVLAYLLDVLNISGNNDTTMFDTSVLIIFGVTSIFAQIIVLSILVKVFKLSDVWLFTIALFIILLSSLFGIFVYFENSLLNGWILVFIFGCSYIASPITSGALSKRINNKDQGLAMGILHSIKAVSGAIAPVMFSTLYKTFENKHYLKTMPFMVASLFVLISFPIALGPLKRALDKSEIESKNKNKKSINRNNNNIKIGNNKVSDSSTLRNMEYHHNGHYKHSLESEGSVYRLSFDSIDVEVSENINNYEYWDSVNNGMNSGMNENDEYNVAAELGMDGDDGNGSDFLLAVGQVNDSATTLLSANAMVSNESIISV